MKFKNLLRVALLACPATALAVPAPSGLLTVSNPDGTTIQVRAYGDEHFHYYTDPAGKYLLSTDARGYWTQVERQGRALTASEADINLLWTESPAYVRSLNPVELPGSQKRMAALQSSGQTTYNTEGDIPACVILVEFKDTKFSMADPKSLYNDFCNKPGYDAYKSCGSARDYFMHVSGGKFRPQFEVYGPIQAQQNAQYYSAEANDHVKLGELITDALHQLDDDVDFSRFDLDGDGIIDNIYFLYAGHGAADTGRRDLIWPHQGHYYNFKYYEGLPDLIVDGVKMATYAIGNELKGDTRLPYGATSPWADGIGTFCHEYGHVLGLPDMYDAKKQSSGSGVTTPTPDKYSIMDQGSYSNYSTRPPGYSAYEKWLCKWLEYEDLEDGKDYIVKSHSDGSNPVAYRSRVPRAGTTNRYTSEYFIIEARTNTSWDESFPEQGMFIWRIDFDKSVWVSNDVNTGGIAHVQLMPSQDLGTKVYAWPSSVLGGETIDASYPGFHPLTPSAYSPSYSFILTGMEFDPNTGEGKFSHNLVTKAPEITTEACIPTRYDDSRDLHISWKPVEGADSYAVTMTRTNISGKTYSVDGLTEKNVGNVNELRVRNISASAYDMDFSYYVRPVMVIPSSQTSNVVNFKTSDLLTFDPADPWNEKANNGVDGIMEESGNIMGGIGCVIAPAGAEVYTLSGQRCDANHLSAGIYIVRHGNKAVKVIVK